MLYGTIDQCDQAMARLNSLQSRLTKDKPRLGYGDASDRSAYRKRTEAWQSWYKSAKWQRIRWSVLTRDLFTCQICGQLKGDTSQLVCDHIVPHKGDPALFWAGPFQTLCKACHDSTKQRQDMRKGQWW